VRDLARGSIYVEQGRMYKPIEFEVVEGEGLERILSVIGGRSVAIDFETVGKDVWVGGFRPITVALSVCDKTFVVDLEKLGEEKEKEFMKEVFERAERIIVYNAGFDVVIGVSRYGWELHKKVKRIEDVQVMNYLLSGKAVPEVSLKDLVLDYLDVGQYGIDWKKTKIEELPRGKLYEYNALDAYCALKLFELFKERLEKAPLRWDLIFGKISKSLLDVYEEVLKKIVCLCVELQVNGLYADVDYLVQLKKDLERKRLEFLKSVSGVNLNSPKQVLRWLADVGVVLDSTRKEILESFLKENEGKISESAKSRVELLLEYRVIEKMLGTYVDPFLERWISNDGCVHSKFSVVSTDTGRLSSSEPNLMNIPTRLGPVVEKAFVSRFGEEGMIVKADFSQHELRVACQYSKDRKMKEFFESGVDIHTKVAMEIYGMPEDAPEEVKKEYRRRAKAYNFGVIYGMSHVTISKDLSVPVEEAKKMLERYFQMFPELKVWLDSVREFVGKVGYVRSMFGRFRWIDPVEDVEGWKQKAVNTPVQSAASDIAALTAWRIVERLKAEGFKSKVVNFVHDSVLVDCPVEEVEEVCRVIKEEVQKIELPEEKFLDFEIDIAVGKSWGECKE
jgi:DNA polymerase-1